MLWHRLHTLSRRQTLQPRGQFGAVDIESNPETPMRIALYQPDIPQNTGTILRMAACLGVTVDLIGPAGFDFSDKALRRAGLDYLAHATLARHDGWTSFNTWRKTSAERHRLVLLTTQAETAFHCFRFTSRDCLLLGRESAGVPQHVHDEADARVRIPMREGLRSLNIAVAAAIVLGEGLRQTGGFDDTLKATSAG